MRFQKIGSIFLLSLSLAPSLFALEIPSKPANYVTDKAQMLSPFTASKLNVQLAEFEKNSKHQIFVATFPSLEGQSLEEFSIRLAEAWKPGQKGMDDGILFLIFKQDRKTRIEVGYGLEAAIPDSLAGQILQNVVAPLFRQGNYEGGIEAGVDAIMQAIDRIPLSAGKGYHKTKSSTEGGSEIMTFIGLFFLLFLIIDLIHYSFYLASHWSYHSRYRALEWWLRFSVFIFILKLISMFLENSSVRGSGNGSSSSYSGSEGFSGGGGGGFGGGGASGGW